MDSNSCPACGNIIQPGESYCTGCGANLTYSDKTETRKSPNIIRDYSLIFLMLAVFGFGYLLLNGKPYMIEQPRNIDKSVMPPGKSLNIEHILANLPDDYKSLVQTGNNYMDRAIYHVAIESYQRALAIDSTSPNVFVDLGACRHAVGEIGKAIELFEKALSLDSSHAIACFNLGIAHNDLSQKSKAEYYWNRFIQLSPASPLADTARAFIKRLSQ